MYNWISSDSTRALNFRRLNYVSHNKAYVEECHDPTSTDETWSNGLPKVATNHHCKAAAI
eukprot:5446273-Pleurochrysis_carterae.AAC.1